MKISEDTYLRCTVSKLRSLKNIRHITITLHLSTLARSGPLNLISLKNLTYTVKKYRHAGSV